MMFRRVDDGDYYPKMRASIRMTIRMCKGAPWYHKFKRKT